MTVSAKGRRAKGSGFELKCAQLMAEWVNECLPSQELIEFRRTPLSGGWARDVEDVQGDLVPIMAGSVHQDFPLVIECKKQEGWSLDQFFVGKGPVSKWWQQVCKASPPNKEPILLFSKNRYPTLVMIPNQCYYLNLDHASIDKVIEYRFPLDTVKEPHVQVYTWDEFVQCACLTRLSVQSMEHQ